MARKFPIRRLGDDENLAQLDWEQVATGTGTSTNSLHWQRAANLHRAISRLLAGWPMEDIELAAWEFALDGWQRTPPLVADYDVAFGFYLQVLEELRTGPANDAGRDSLTTLIEEFRTRVQFLQTRGADIRLSSQVERLAEASLERVLPVLQDLNRRLANGANPAAILGQFEREARGGMITAAARAIGRWSPEVGASILSAERSEVLAAASAAIAAIPGGVAGNAVYDGLVRLMTLLR